MTEVSQRELFGRSFEKLGQDRLIDARCHAAPARPAEHRNA